MSSINKAAVLNPFTDLTANILDYVPRATTAEFGIVAIGSGINVDALGRIYLDTQEYSDRLTAIDAHVASTLDTQKSEVAAAIAQVNLTQSQTITVLTLEVSNLRTNLTDSITATQTDLINRADQLAQNVTDITDQLAQDKVAFTQEIQDALDSLKDGASVASALRTPRKIQGVSFDGTQDISLPTFSTQIDGLVPKRVGATTTNYLCEDGTWAVPPDTTYALLTKASAEDGTATTANTISAQVLKEAIQYHAPTVTNIVGNAETATKLQTPRTINGVLFDGTQDILLPSSEDYSLPTASASVLGGIKVGSGLTISNSVLSVDTLNQSTLGNAATATKLETARKINGVDFDGTQDITLPLASTSVSGTVQLNNTLTSVNTDQALTAAQGKKLNDSKLGKSENAVSASKLETSRTISLAGGVTGSVSFDGSTDVSLATTITGLGVANGIATLDANGQVPSTQLPSYVDDILEYENVAAFPTTGVAGKIYVETTDNTTYRWGGTSYVKITPGEVASVAGKTGVVTLIKSDVGLSNVDNTPDVQKPISVATQQALDTKVNTSDVIAIAKGGTGASTAEDARTNLDVMSSSEVAAAIATSVPQAADATTIDKGIVRLATESDITNSSETAVVTPKNVAAMLVGVGSLAKGFRALFSARLTQMTGTNTSNGNTITCTITAHGLRVGDVISINYGYTYRGNQRATDTVTVTSVANANTFTFTSPQTASGSASASACTLYYVIKNNYNVNSLAINSVGRYTISINAASDITGTNFIPFIQATTTDNSLVIVQPEAITSATSLTVRTFNAVGAAITPQWLHIGVMQ